MVRRNVFEANCLLSTRFCLLLTKFAFCPCPILPAKLSLSDKTYASLKCFFVCRRKSNGSLKASRLEYPDLHRNGRETADALLELRLCCMWGRPTEQCRQCLRSSTLNVQIANNILYPPNAKLWGTHSLSAADSPLHLLLLRVPQVLTWYIALPATPKVVYTN